MKILKGYLPILALTGGLVGGPSSSAVELHKEYAAGGKFVNYDVGGIDAETLAVPVHPEDSGFLSGETAAEDIKDRDSPFHPVNYHPYLKAAIGPRIDWFTVTFGLQININFRPLIETLGEGNGYRTGIVDVRQQISDTRPATIGSFVYSKLRPTFYTITPSVDMRADLIPGSKEFFIGGGVTFPYTKFELETGHDRFGRWEEVNTYSWRGSGQGFYGSIGWGIDTDDDGKKDMRVDLEYNKENFNPRFNGDGSRISTESLGLTGSFRF